MQFIEDWVVRPDHLATYLEPLGEILAREETDAVIFGHAGDGNVHVNPPSDVGRREWRARVRRILEATVDLLSSLNGALSGVLVPLAGPDPLAGLSPDPRRAP